MSEARLAVALAPYQAGSPTELTVAEQEQLWVLAEQPEEAQRDGWVAVLRCADPHGEPGLLPADYVAVVDARVSLHDETATDEPNDATDEPANENDGALAGWLAAATLVLADADEGAALEAEALADFEPMSDVELRLVAGERLALLLSPSDRAAPPDGWKVALQHQSRDSGGRAAKGLVPATFIRLLPFEATVLAAAEQPTTDPYSPSAPVAMVRDRFTGELVMSPALPAPEEDAAQPKELAVTNMVTKGERVRVLPERSTDTEWWVQRYQLKRRLSLAYDKRAVGGEVGLSGEEGAVAKARLQPISAASLQEGLQREAQAVRVEGAAVLTMHRYVRGWVTRHNMRVAKRNGASRTITHAVRGAHGRHSFVAQRAAALFIERCWRGVLGRRRVESTRRQLQWESDTEKARLRAARKRAEREAHQTTSVVAAAMAARVMTDGVAAAAKVEEERARRRAEEAAAEAARRAAAEAAEEEARRAAMSPEARAALEAREAAEATPLVMRRESSAADARAAGLAEQRRLAAEQRRPREEERRREAAEALVAAEAEAVVAAAVEAATVAAVAAPSAALMAAVVVSVAATMVDEATAAAMEAAVAAAVMTAEEAAEAAQRAEAQRARAAAHRAAVAAAEAAVVAASAAAAAEEERSVAEAAAKAKARAMARAKALGDKQEAALRALQEAEEEAAAQEAAATSAQLAREKAAARLLEAQSGAGAKFAAISRELELTRMVLAEQRRSIALAFARRDRGWVRMRRLRLLQSDAPSPQEKKWSDTIFGAISHRDATLPQEQHQRGGGKGQAPKPTMSDLDDRAADEQLAYAAASAAAIAGPPPGRRTASSSPRSWRLGRLSSRPQPSTDDDATPDGGAVALVGMLGTLSSRSLAGTKEEWVVETYLTPAPPPRRADMVSPRGAHAMPPLWCPQRVSDVLGRGGIFDTFGFAAASRHLST